MLMDFTTPKRGKNIFEFVYSIVAARRDKDAPLVQCVNQQNIIVDPLDPYRPFLRFDSLKNKLIGFIFVVAVILADETFMSITYKVWLISLVTLVYLLYSDYKRMPIRYVHPSRFDGEFHEEESQYNKTISLEEEQVIKEFISVSQCEFHILQVKVIDHNDGISNTGLHAPVAGSKAIFQITIICGRSRWEVWRKYEHFCKVYDNLCTKYTNHKIAKLPSLDSIKQTWRQMGSSPGEGGDANFGEDDMQDDAIFLGHSFLQKLQAEMLGWLRTMQLDPIGDDNSIRALLKLPPYKAHPVTSGFSSPSAHHHSNGRPASVSSRASGRSTHVNTVSTPVHNHHKHSIHTTHTLPANDVNSTNNTDSAPATYTTLDGQTGTVEPVPPTPSKNLFPDVSMHNIDPITGLEISTTATNMYISPCGCWKGNSVDTFQWLDMDQKARDMYIDIKYSHDFKVRGATYLTDKKKVDAGPSISRLIMMENFHVNTAKYGDRLDHICQIGRVKRRVEIMHNLPGNPFVLVLNLQIPGDPPVSIVFYFLVPTTFYPGKNPSDGLDATREMFRKLIDCPITPPVEENQAYLDEVNEMGLGRTVRQDSDEPDKKDATKKKASKLSETKNKSSFYVPPAPKSWTADVVWPDMKVPQPGVLAKDSFQNKRFKLIPSMVEAPWVVQMAVSSTPVLLGQKVVQRYFRGEGYIEMDVHIGSSAIADNIVGVCRSYSKAFICNLGIVIQGESEEELPEHVLACAALKYCDVDVFSPLESYNF